MNKYTRICEYLKGVKEDDISIGYDKISELLEGGLPRSAMEHRSWWGNDRTHVQAVDGWLKAGWKVRSFRAGIVRFVRTVPQDQPQPNPKNASKVFQELAQRSLSEVLDVRLQTMRLEGVPKEFGLVSPDGKFIGDTRFMSMVRTRKTPSAHHSVISELIWLLGRTHSDRLFLAFGNEKAVATSWLERYGQLLDHRYMIYFVPPSGRVEILYDGWSQRPNPPVVPAPQRSRWSFRRRNESPSLPTRSAQPVGTYAAPRNEPAPRPGPKPAEPSQGWAANDAPKVKAPVASSNVPEPVDPVRTPVQNSEPAGCPHRFLNSKGRGTPKGGGAPVDVFECKACGKAFAVTKKIDPKVCEHKNLASLGESMALSTGERDEVFECIHCGRTFQIK